MLSVKLFGMCVLSARALCVCVLRERRSIVLQGLIEKRTFVGFVEFMLVKGELCSCDEHGVEPQLQNFLVKHNKVRSESPSLSTNPAP